MSTPRRRSSGATARRGAGQGGPRRAPPGACPRCGARKTGRIPSRAIVLAVVLFPIGLLFLLAKERRGSRCG